MNNIVFRCWTYMRRAQGIYLAMLMTHLTNSIIYYRMLIEYIPTLQKVFPSFTIFVVSFSIPYFLVAVVIGYLDYKKGSVRTDGILAAEANPVTQTSLTSSMYAQLGFIKFIQGEDEEAVRCLEKSIDHLSKWGKFDE